MPPTPTIPGWYDDFDGRRRWWDGQRWGAYAPWDGLAAPPRPIQKAAPSLDSRYLHDPTGSPRRDVVVHHVHHMHPAPAKDMAIAYLLLIFLGPFGAHRFYLDRNGTAIAQLAMTLAGSVLVFVLVGLFVLFAMAIWWIVDLFLTAGMVREYNARAAMQAGHTGYARGWPAA